jgi:hypothetical protein
MYPTRRQVLWALCWPIILRHSFCRFLTRCCMSGIRAIHFRFSILVVPVHRFLAMSQSFVVLGCRTWNALPHEDFAYTGFICFRCEEDGLWRECYCVSKRISPKLNIIE